MGSGAWRMTVARLGEEPADARFPPASLTSRTVKPASLERLRALLVGTQFTRVTYNDAWSLQNQHGISVNAHEFKVSTENALRQHLGGSPVDQANEPDVVVTATAVFALLRQEITDVALGPQGELILRIQGEELTARTDVDIVDWQWCVGPHPGNPYSASQDFACFWRGEVVEGAKESG